MAKFIVTLALFVVTGFSASAQQTGTNDTGNGIWWNGRFGCCPLTPDYLKKTVRVEILGNLTYIPPSLGSARIKETTEVEARGRIQTIRVKNINVLDPTGGDEIVEVNFIVNGKTYNLELTPEMWKLAVKVEGNEVILHGILNNNTITVKSLKEMVLEFDNFNRPVAF